MARKHVVGAPCQDAKAHVLGGFTTRYVSTGRCVLCAKAKTMRWRAENAQKHAAYAKQYYAANAVELAAKKAAAHKKDPSKNSNRQRRYRAVDVEATSAREAAWRAANKESCAAWSSAYRLRNLDKYAAYAAKRRASEAKRTPVWADTSAIKSVYLDAATHPSGEPMHVDHIVPLRGKRVSGLHVANNLRVIPASENVRKHAKFDPWTHVHEVNHHG